MLQRTLLAAAALALCAGPAARAATDPATARVEVLCGGLLDAVKAAKGGGAGPRARKIQPVVDQNFNLEAMAQFTIGEPWAKMSGADHAALVAAMSRYMAARYAKEFEAAGEQRCVVDPAAVARGVDKLVKSQIVERGEAEQVNYRLREYGGAWKVIDVFYKGVSQLATQRADFAGLVRSGGAAPLVAKLNQLTAEMR
jgi:phospholipid transport system substrate-binding protein